MCIRDRIWRFWWKWWIWRFWRIWWFWWIWRCWVFCAELLSLWKGRPSFAIHQFKSINKFWGSVKGNFEFLLEKICIQWHLYLYVWLFCIYLYFVFLCVYLYLYFVCVNQGSKKPNCFFRIVLFQCLFVVIHLIWSAYFISTAIKTDKNTSW